MNPRQYFLRCLMVCSISIFLICAAVEPKRQPAPEIPTILVSADTGAEATWYQTPRTLSVAANPRMHLKDGTLVLLVNESQVPETAVVVKVQGHMKPGARADFDLSPDAFKLLAPLKDGRIQLRWLQVYP